MPRPLGGREANIFHVSAQRPALIAHGGGNSRAAFEATLQSGADLVEVDLWVHNGSFESRHERRLPLLPLLFDSWALRIPPRRPLPLLELLDACHGRMGVLLDLKNRTREAIELVRLSLQRLGRSDSGVLASSQSWPLLRGLNLACPQVGVLYSIDSRAQLELFRSISLEDRTAVGVSCRHSLLDDRLVAELHGQRVAVSAWTVNDLERARELAAFGVDGLTTSAPAKLSTLVV